MLTSSIRPWVWVPLCAVALGCRAHRGGDDLVVGRDPPRAAGTSAIDPEKRGSTAGTTSPSRAAAGSKALNAAIQNREGVTVDVVTVGCAGTCFEVVAVAHGGYPPYAYRWEDGSSNPIRTICPDATGRFTVVATDRGYASEEFTREAETVTAEVTAEVLSCPDAGSAVPGVPDAGAPDAALPQPSFKWEPLCIENGSFEDPSGTPWRACPVDDPEAVLDIERVGSTFFSPEAFDGNYYLRMDPTPERPVMISQRLCAPVRRGTGYHWTQAETRGSASAAAVLVEFYLSRSECGTDGKISDSQPLVQWSELCAGWPAAWDAQYLVIKATAIEDAPGTVYIDDLLAVTELCPAP